MNPTSNTRAAAIAIGVVLLLAPLGLAAQRGDYAALRVRVIDAATGTPIYGARVGFPELKLFSLTDRAGFAQIVTVPPGDRSLEVTMLGYGAASTAMTFESHAVATGDIALRSVPIRIQGITVMATAEIKRLDQQGFYQRRKVGIGHFLGPLEISKSMAQETSGLFEGMPAVQVIPSGGPRPTHELFTRRSCMSLSEKGGGGGKRSAFGGGPSDFDGGRLRLYLDGVPYTDEIDDLPLDMIQAAEVYVGAEVPVQFAAMGAAGNGASGDCGVVMLWTK